MVAENLLKYNQSMGAHHCIHNCKLWWTAHITIITPAATGWCCNLRLHFEALNLLQLSPHSTGVSDHQAHGGHIRHTVLCQCLFAVAETLLLRELRSFVAGVHGLGCTYNTRLQFWCIFESLSCFSLTQLDAPFVCWRKIRLQQQEEQLVADEHGHVYLLTLSPSPPTSALFTLLNLKSSDA